MSDSDNKTTLEVIGMAQANSLLNNALEWTTSLESLPSDERIAQEARTILMLGHAHIQQQERIAIQYTEVLKAIADKLDLAIEQLSNIAEATDFIAASKPE